MVKVLHAMALQQQLATQQELLAVWTMRRTGERADVQRKKLLARELHLGDEGALRLAADCFVATHGLARAWQARIAQGHRNHRKQNA